MPFFVPNVIAFFVVLVVWIAFLFGMLIWIATLIPTLMSINEDTQQVNAELAFRNGW